MSQDPTQDPQLNSSNELRASYARRLLGFILSAPVYEERDCEDTDWFCEMQDWAVRVAEDTGCPPENSHLFGCDQCYSWFDWMVRHHEWVMTDEGSRYWREYTHWSWNNLIARGALLEPRTGVLQEGDIDYTAINGRPPIPESMPQYEANV